MDDNNDRIFPLHPKSTKDLRIGDFWAVPLSNNTFGCVQITDLKSDNLKAFIIGVLNWSGSSQPTLDEIAGTPIIEQGMTRIEAIGGNNSEILGNAVLPDMIAGASNFRDFGTGVVHHTYGSNNLANSIVRIINV